MEQRKLVKLLLSITVILCLFGCKTTSLKTDDYANANVDLSKIEADGAALYAAMQSDDASDAPTSRESDLIEMASRQLLCDGDYTAVRVDDHVAQLEHIYLILQPEKSNGIQVGRHARFDFKLGTNKIESVTPSTKSCLLIPPEVSSADAVFVTHLLSDTPTDFHVYLNLFHEKTIFVSTTSGLWKLEDGKIFKSE